MAVNEASRGAPARAPAPSRPVAVAWSVGMVALFTGERLIGEGKGRGVAAVLGLGLVAGAFGVRLARFVRSAPPRRSVERWLALLQGAGTGALAMYWLQSDVFFRPGGKALTESLPRLTGALGALWPAIWLAAALALVMGELAYAAILPAARLEARRVGDAIRTGLGLAAVLTFSFAVYFATSERDKKLDLSHFRTARPGESTRKIARALTDDVEVVAFFPPANEVGEEVASYLADLGRESPRLKVAHLDQALEPKRAKDLGASANGSVVFKRGGRKETLYLAVELDSAKSKLRTLDKEVQKRLIAVAKPPRNAYFTQGHEERARDRQGEGDKRGTVRGLRDLLEDQGFTVKDLGAAEGLGTEVPEDAGVLLLVGPRKPVAPEETAALLRYVDRGGRLLVALDPEAELAMKDLLGPLALAYTPVALASEVFAKRTGQTSERVNIYTGVYSSHASVSTLGRYGMRAPLILIGAGSLEEAKDRPKDLAVDLTVRSGPTTWNDANRNFAFESPTESKKSWGLAAAVSRRKSGAPDKDEGRVVVLGDSDALSDDLLAYPGNQLYFLDSLRWLGGDEAQAGEITSEEDVPVAHTRKEDTAWFYGTTFLGPALVVAAGLFVTRRRSRTTPARGPAGPAAGPPRDAGGPPAGAP